MPSGTRLVAQGFILMLDNDPKHFTKLCWRYIISKEEQHVLQLMSWLVQSVVLNPIELVWDEIEYKSELNSSKYSSSLATLAGKLGRTIFSLPPVFVGKNAENL